MAIVWERANEVGLFSSVKESNLTSDLPHLLACTDGTLSMPTLRLTNMLQGVRHHSQQCGFV